MVAKSVGSRLDIECVSPSFSGRFSSENGRVVRRSDRSITFIMDDGSKMRIPIQCYSESFRPKRSATGGSKKRESASGSADKKTPSKRTTKNTTTKNTTTKKGSTRGRDYLKMATSSRYSSARSRSRRAIPDDAKRIDISNLAPRFRSILEGGELKGLVVLHETDKAYLLYNGRLEQWVPKSCVDESYSQYDNRTDAQRVSDTRDIIGNLHLSLLHAEDGEYENILSVPLRQYQRDVLKTLDGKSRVALFADMGTGKTPMSLARMILFDDDLPNLIICRKSLMSQWRSEIDKFCPWMQDRIFIINYDMIFRDSAKEFLSQFRPGEFNLTLEEVGCLGNEDAKRTRKCMELASQCRNLQMLTGSFFGGRFEKFYPCAVMQGYKGSRDEYEDRYCIKVRQTRVVRSGRSMIRVPEDRIVAYQHIPDLIEETAKRGAVFIRTEDCLDLPEENREIITVPSTDEGREIDSQIRQSSQSGVAPSQGLLVRAKTTNDLANNDEKREWIEDTIQSSDDRWCIFYQYNEEKDVLLDILKRLGRPVSEVSGDVRDLTAYENDVNSVTIIQIVAGAEGLNLQKCNRSIFTMPFNADQQLQAERRTRRMGQTRPCFYYILATDSAYDQARLKDVAQKRRVVGSIG